MKQSDKAVEVLAQSIRMAVNQYLTTAPFDITVRGKITEIVSANCYRVEISGSSYTITDTNTHAVGDIVNILIPRNSYSDMFILPTRGGSEIPSTGMVLSVNGKTGNVIINIDDINNLTSVLSTKVDKISGLALSENSYTTSEKNKLANIEANANNYTHPQNHPASMITQDTNNRFVSDTEKTDWNNAFNSTHIHSNKSILDNTTASFTIADETKLDSVAPSASKVEQSTTNGNIKINDIEKTVYTHPTGTNPHGTTKSDIGLGSVDNTSDLNKPISTAAQAALDNKLDINSDIKDNTVSFTQSATRINITTNEKLSVLMGKISKWFTDLKALAFKDKVSKSDFDSVLTSEIDNKSNIGHTHSKSNIIDFAHTHTNSDLPAYPTTLPANGGNSDTVDGKHASEFYQDGTVVMNTNPFGGKKLYINNINNALFIANKRWEVTGSIYNLDDSLFSTINDTSLATMFNGDYENGLTILPDKYAVINIRFNGGYFPSYPYGNLYLSHYHTNHSKSAKVRVYCNYAAHGIGWHEFDFVDYIRGGQSLITTARILKYQISEMEFVIYSPSTNNTQITQIDFQLDRPSSPNEMPFVDKYRQNKLYFPLDMNNNTILNIPTPTASNNAANKQYIDDGLLNKSDKSHNHDTFYEPKNSNIQSHLSSLSNPHNTTKTQIGLGNVENYGVATQAESEEGASNVKYMTPLRTKQAIDKFSPKDTSELSKTDVYTKSEIQSLLSATGNGDMLKSVYDTNSNGVVDNAERFGGKLPNEFASVASVGDQDLNTIITSGMYRINGSNPNRPSGSDWGNMVVIRGGSDTIAQMVFDYSQNRCWHRSGNPPNVGGSGVWTSWKLVNDGGNADTLNGKSASDFVNLQISPSQPVNQNTNDVWYETLS